MDGTSEQYLLQGRTGKGSFKGVHVFEHALLDQDSPSSQQLIGSKHKRSSSLTGWRKGVTTGICSVLVSLLINIAAVVAFVVRFGVKDGLTVLYEGDCSRASNINLGIHLAINGLGTLLLAASNYCMQVLSAPTRQEVNRAHARQKWMDIGLSSFRNLFSIQRWRVWVWILLLVSSLPLHLVYNSVVFSSVGAYEYTGVVVTPGFVGASPYNGTFKVWTDNEVIGNSPTLSDVQRVQADASTFERLNNTACIAKYHQALVTDQSDLILVSSSNDVTGNDSEVYLAFRDGDFYVGFDGVAGWICDVYNETIFDRCLYKLETPDPDTWSIEDHPIDYCLSRNSPEVCKVKSSVYLMFVVILCNLAKLAAMLTTLMKHREDSLITIGDAVSSFIEMPDQYTKDACLISKHDVASGLFWRESTHIRTWKRRSVFYFGVVSGKRWWSSVFTCLVDISVIAVFLGLAITGLQTARVVSSNSTPSLSVLWGLGFGLGKATSFWQNAPQSLYGNIMIANLPQLIFSMLYFVYNSMYTSMSLASEWSSFSRRRKALRVSRPQGAQRSTYYLQLPYTYAIPLIVASGLMHWLISQSFFLLSVDFAETGSSEMQSFATCGYSPIAIVFGLGLATLMVIVIVLNGFRRMTYDIPPVGSCSVAISAACHAPMDGQDASTVVQWGVVPSHTSRYESDVGHCSFSSAEVMPPVQGEKYGRLDLSREEVARQRKQP